jgi:hypothetical protein
VALPGPGVAWETLTSQTAVPIALVVISVETIGPRPWIATVKVALAFASGPPLKLVACSVSFSVACDDEANLLGMTASWAASWP